MNLIVSGISPCPGVTFPSDPNQTVTLTWSGGRGEWDLIGTDWVYNVLCGGNKLTIGVSFRGSGAFVFTSFPTAMNPVTVSNETNCTLGQGIGGTAVLSW